jgi:hypothetical protein
MDQKEANQLLISAYLAKTAECGTDPGFPILSTSKYPFEFSINACALSIIQSSCPFTSYPLLCLEVFKIDIPNVGPRIPK